ncbi:MAG: hypothetical protein Q7V12_11155, partial [Deltaproteobacteria bacterium]|nr:hypothetical protein [Deltaproteobacteria bacterium]
AACGVIYMHKQIIPRPLAAGWFIFYKKRKRDVFLTPQLKTEERVKYHPITKGLHFLRFYVDFFTILRYT